MSTEDMASFFEYSGLSLIYHQLPFGECWHATKASHKDFLQLGGNFRASQAALFTYFQSEIQDIMA